MKRILLAIALLTRSAFGSDYIAAEEIIRQQVDIVIYGTLETFPDQIAKVSMKPANREFHYEFMRVEVQPWAYVPDLSVRFRHQETYSAYVNSEHWPAAADYSTKPRFWGLKMQEIMGYVAIELQPREPDTKLQAIKKEVDIRYQDPTVIRPISLSGIQDGLSIEVVHQDEELMLEVHNKTEYTIWYKMIAAERLASKKDSYTFTIQGEREDGGWTWDVCGLSGVGRENDRFAIPVEIKPKSVLRFPISVWKGQNEYEHFRAQGVLYPSAELINGLYMFSAPFELTKKQNKAEMATPRKPSD